MPYFTAAVFDHGNCITDFGDREKSVVDYEVQDWRDHDVLAKNIERKRWPRIPTRKMFEDWLYACKMRRAGV